MEFDGITGLLRGKPLLCSPCLDHSGIPGIPVRMWLGDPCRLDMHREGCGDAAAGVGSGYPKAGGSHLLCLWSLGLPSQECLSRQDFKKDKTTQCLLVFLSSLNPELMEVMEMMSVH